MRVCKEGRLLRLWVAGRAVEAADAVLGGREEAGMGDAHCGRAGRDALDPPAGDCTLGIRAGGSRFGLQRLRGRAEFVVARAGSGGAEDEAEGKRGFADRDHRPRLASRAARRAARTVALRRFHSFPNVSRKTVTAASTSSALGSMPTSRLSKTDIVLWFPA